jgi:hypothetical protein
MCGCIYGKILCLIIVFKFFVDATELNIAPPMFPGFDDLMTLMYLIN